MPKIAQTLFKKWGKRGGETRKRILSPNRRHAIASLAARTRWGNRNSVMPSVRLEAPSWNDPVYIEELLSEGGLDDWRALYHRVAEHPFEETAKALEKVVSSVEIYGATKLWKSFLRQLQGG